MCILFLFIDPNPAKDGYRLILALNRDEFYERPTKASHEWEEDPNIIGGRDMQSGREGGTWFAVKVKEKSLRLGTLLNITGGVQKPNCPGRGALVTDYVKSNIKTADYIKDLRAKAQNYNAFNFVTGEISENVCSVSCTSSDLDISEAHEWTTGTNENKEPIKIGFGNSTFDKPFKKVTAGLEHFSNLIESITTRDSLIEELTHLLQSRERHWPDDVLSNISPWGEHLCSIYVENLQRKYGTRTHTIVLLDYQWRLDFIDLSLNTTGIGDSAKWIKNHIIKYINCKL